MACPPSLIVTGPILRSLRSRRSLINVSTWREDLTTHGFRSTFRDWAAETTAYPTELCEMALAHTVSDKVEAAYRRGDMVEKRRRLMADWAGYCAAPERTGNVMPLRSVSHGW